MLMDSEAQWHLGIDGDEFLANWDAGEYDVWQNTEPVRTILSLALIALR